MPGDVSKAPREWKPTLLAKNCSNAFVVSPCVSMWIQIALLCGLGSRSTGLPTGGKIGPLCSMKYNLSVSESA